MSLKDILDRVNWFIRLIVGEYAKVVGAFMAWQAGLPVDIVIQINQARFKFVAQESPEPGVRRRLRIDELL